MTRFAVLLLCLVPFLPLKAEGAELSIQMAPPELNLGEIFTQTSLTMFVTSPEPGDLVLVFEGPASTYAIMRKELSGLLWLNGKRLVFSQVPSFYLISSTRPLRDIMDTGTQQDMRLPLQRLLPDTVQTSDPEFAEAFLRLKQQNRHFAFEEGKIEGLPNNSFRADLHIPSNVPVGSYKTKAYLFREGKLVVSGEKSYAIRKTGLNLALSDLIRQHRILSSLLSIGLMLAIGLLGSFLMPRR